MKMLNGETSSISAEYLATFPNDERQARLLEMYEASYCQSIIMEKMKLKPLSDEDFTKAENFQKRWAGVILDGPRLASFLREPRRMGDIYVRENYPTYHDGYYQTIRNTSTANQVYEFGHTYVGFGYVDLFQIVWGSLFNIRHSNILTYYGWDMSQVSVLRSKLIYIIFKYFEEEEINTRSALQIWFSSCWDVVTLKAFKLLIGQLIVNQQKYSLSDDDISLLRVWKKTKISTQAAKSKFSKDDQNPSFDNVWRLKSRRDRLMFSRYIFTGCIFADEDITLCGNPTMFTDYKGQTKIPEELFFQGIDLRATSLEKIAGEKDTLFDTITCATMEAVLNFRSLVKSQRIVCHLQTKTIDPNDMKFADEVKALNPYGIDWSNLPDYMEKKSFIRFAKACSVDDTIHQLHFLNWPQYVFGACHVDWENFQDECNQYYKEFNQIQMELSLTHANSNLHSFFKDVYVNPLNAINTMLCTKFRQTFEDFFLSDNNGKILNRNRCNYCDSLHSNFFTQSPTWFKSTFTFNNTIRLEEEEKSFA